MQQRMECGDHWLIYAQVSHGGLLDAGEDEKQPDVEGDRTHEAGPPQAGLDPLELTARLRKADPRLRIILLANQPTVQTALTALANRVCDLLLRPLQVEDLRLAITSAVNECRIHDLGVVSADQNWVQLRVPCDLNIVPILQKLLTILQSDLPEETCEGMAYAFREMLNNAIEHSEAKRCSIRCSFDPATLASISKLDLIAKTVVDAGVDMFVIRGTTVSAEHVSSQAEPLNLKEFIYELDVPVIVGGCATYQAALHLMRTGDRKSTRLNSSHRT